MGPYQVLPIQARVDLEAMTVKGYSAFPQTPAIRLYSVITRTLIGRVLPLCGDVAGVFCSPIRLGH